MIRKSSHSFIKSVQPVLMEVSVVYRLNAEVAHNYYKAQQVDFLPDANTEKRLGMGGGGVGIALFHTFKTLDKHGRLSRTIIEQALMHSDKSYPTYMKWWISSLPPRERSRYAALLYNTKYKDLQWDEQYHAQTHAAIIEEGPSQLFTEPPFPLGDDRHSPKNAAIIRIASHFYDLIHYNQLFDECDAHAPLSIEFHEFSEDNFLQRNSSLFGFDYEDLEWKGQSSDGRLDELSNSEVVLRAWYILYIRQRLSKIELEHALQNGPEAMKRLFSNGMKLASMFYPFPEHESILRRTMRLQNVAFRELQKKDYSIHDKNKECDYCGVKLEKPSQCNGCRIAMYCGKECQRGDWKRHQLLCPKYKELCSQQQENQRSSVDA